MKKLLLLLFFLKICISLLSIEIASEAHSQQRAAFQAKSKLKHYLDKQIQQRLNSIFQEFRIEKESSTPSSAETAFNSEKIGGLESSFGDLTFEYKKSILNKLIDSSFTCDTLKFENRFKVVYRSKPDALTSFFSDQEDLSAGTSYDSPKTSLRSAFLEIDSHILYLRFYPLKNSLIELQKNYDLNTLDLSRYFPDKISVTEDDKSISIVLTDAVSSISNPASYKILSESQDLNYIFRGNKFEITLPKSFEDYTITIKPDFSPLFSKLNNSSQIESILISKSEYRIKIEKIERKKIFIEGSLSDSLLINIKHLLRQNGFEFVDVRSDANHYLASDISTNSYNTAFGDGYFIELDLDLLLKTDNQLIWKYTSGKIKAFSDTALEKAKETAFKKAISKIENKMIK